MQNTSLDQSPFFSRQQLTLICKEVAPDLPDPALIFSLSDEPLIEEVVKAWSAISNSNVDMLFLEQQQNLSDALRNQTCCCSSFLGSDLGIIYLPGFDSVQGVHRNLEADHAFIDVRIGKGFVDTSPKRIRSSLLQHVRHEARHLVEPQRDQLEQEMLSDAVALLFGLKETFNSGSPLEVEDYRQQCREHAFFRKTSTSLACPYLLCEFVAAYVADLSESVITSLGSSDIETFAQELVGRILESQRQDANSLLNLRTKLNAIEEMY